MNDKPLTNTAPIEERIEGSFDKSAMALTEVSSSVGGLTFKDMGQVMEFSKLMSVSRQAVPKHLRGQPGACMAVSLQALNWRMDPFAVANKSYSVNDRIVYEAQLIQAVIEQRAPIKGRLKGDFIGEGAKRQCRLWCLSEEDGERIEYTSPEIGSITTKNSPLWKSDPDQQLWYYSARAMCRRHFPDVLLGVYEKEEIAHAPELRDVTPKEGGFAARAQAARRQDSPPEENHDTQGKPLDGEILPADEDAAPVEQEQQEDGGTTERTFEHDEGATAFTQGKTASDCPHEDDPQRTNWMAGWNEAYNAAEQEGGEA
ncbi:Rmf/CrpP family protein [Phaeobacter sp. JH20_02]|uniref:ribosome modulation factor n=1 Tax=unclassified Phaeobacter TaxID=2621772 RepID=UPI003A849025